MAKSTKGVVMQRLQDLTKLILAGADFGDIQQFAASQNWNVSLRQLRRYQEQVYARLAESTQRNRTQLLGRHLMQRRALYARAVKISDLRAALLILKDEAELEGLYPPRKITAVSRTDQEAVRPEQPVFFESPAEREARIVRRTHAVCLPAPDGVTESSADLHLHWFRFPDTFLEEQLLQVLALQHVTEQLDRAGLVLWATMQQSLADGDPTLAAIETVQTYLYAVGHEGWQRFCHRLRLDGEALIRANYRGQLLTLANDSLLSAVRDPETVRAQLSSGADQPPVELLTADEVARGWWRLYRQVDRTQVGKTG